MSKKYGMKNPYFFLFILWVLSESLNAQEKENIFPAIITDRPDQTESPAVVPKNFLQIETGFLYSESKENGITEKEWVYNSSLFRYGLLENLELRLALEILSQERFWNPGNKTSFSGTGPLNIGFKIGVTEEKGILPKIGFLGGVFLPFTASDEFKPENTGGDFRLAFSHTLSERLDFSYNLGISWDGEAPHAIYIYSAALGYALSEKISAFVEIFGDLPEGNEAEHFFDTGITYLISDQLQIDLAGGTGLNTAKYFFIGAGVSIRLPE